MPAASENEEQKGAKSPFLFDLYQQIEDIDHFIPVMALGFFISGLTVLNIIQSGCFPKQLFEPFSAEYLSHCRFDFFG